MQSQTLKRPPAGTRFSPLPRSLYLNGIRGLLVVSLFVFFPILFGLKLPPLAVTPAAIAWVFLVGSGLKISVLIFRTSPKIFDLVFWIFVYVFFGLAAVSQIQGNEYPLFAASSTIQSGNYPSHIVLLTQLRIGIGIAAYLGGQWLWHRLSGGRKDTSRWDRFVVSEQRLVWFGIATILVDLALIAKAGPASFFSSRLTLSTTLYGAAGSIKGGQIFALQSQLGGSLQSILLIVPPLVIFVYLLASGLWRRHRLMLLALLAVNIVTNNPISNSRAWVGVVVIGVLASLIDLSKNQRHVYLAVGLIISLLFSLSYLGVFKSSYTESQTTSPPIAQQLKTSPDYGAFQQELNATVWVEENGFTRGRQLVGSAFVFVPHALWKSKPGATGLLVAQAEGLYGNWSSSLWSELFIDWGYPELVLGFVVIGYLFARLDNVFENTSSGIMKVVLPMLATYGVLLIRGSLQASVAYGIPIVVMLFLVLERLPNSERQSNGQARAISGHVTT